MPRLAKPDNPTPPLNRVNKMKKFVWLNAKIKELNNLNDRPIYPSFHKHGVRKVTRRSMDRYSQESHREITSNKWDQWRETEIAQMLLHNHAEIQTNGP